MTTASDDVIEIPVDDIARLFHTLDPFLFRELKCYWLTHAVALVRAPASRKAHTRTG